MAATSKKGSKTTKTKQHRPKLKTSVAKQAQTNAELRQELEARNRDLAESLQRESATASENEQLRQERDEALEHQTATAEVLGIISRSPTDVQPVLDAIVESAAKVCGIDDVVLRLREGNAMVQRAHFGPVPITRVQVTVDEPFFHWICQHGTLHIPNVEEQTEVPFQNFQW